MKPTFFVVAACVLGTVVSARSPMHTNVKRSYNPAVHHHPSDFDANLSLKADGPEKHVEGGLQHVDETDDKFIQPAPNPNGMVRPESVAIESQHPYGHRRGPAEYATDDSHEDGQGKAVIRESRLPDGTHIVKGEYVDPKRGVHGAFHSSYLHHEWTS